MEILLSALVLGAWLAVCSLPLIALIWFRSRQTNLNTLVTPALSVAVFTPSIIVLYLWFLATPVMPIKWTASRYFIAVESPRVEIRCDPNEIMYEPLQNEILQNRSLSLSASSRIYYSLCWSLGRLSDWPLRESLAMKWPTVNRLGNDTAYPGSLVIIVPAGPLAVIAATCLCVMALLKMRKKKATNACQRCDYLLIGNISGMCPECGWKTSI